jgi:formylglycine-generating enzyme required for sulfatase activity
MEQEIFISYARRDASLTVAEALDAFFQERGVKITRDNRDIGYKGLIKEYMQRLGGGKYIVLVLSDAYFTSESCMFELLELWKHGEVTKRIFPVTVPGTRFYKVRDRLQYVRYWETECEQLEQDLRASKSIANLPHDDLTLYVEIRNHIAEMLDFLRDLNTAPLENNNFEPLWKAIQVQMAEDLTGFLKPVRSAESAATLTAEQLAAVREAYLNHLLETCGQVFLGGIDRKAASQQGQRCLQLSAIYTALLTFGFDHEQEWRDKAQVADMLAHLAEQRERAASALDLLNKHPRLVLLGDPGSGKSTFVNFVALCLAGEGLKNKDINLRLLTNPLPDDKGKDQKERQPWEHGGLLPVRVILRDFAATGLPPVNHQATVKHLWEFLSKQWEQLQLRACADEVERCLRQEGGLVLFDGLDEVPEANARRVQIKQVVEAFAAAFPKCRIVVTSRTYAYYNQDWRLSGFREGILAPFTQGQIVRFIDHWYAHSAVVRGMSAENALGQAEILKRVIFASPQLRNLAERPLLLTLMASLHYWRGGSLPDKREELYNDVVDLLLDWWESPKMIRDANGQYSIAQESLTELLKIGKDRVRKALNLLAFQAHESQPDSSGTADISQDKLIGTLLRVGQNKDLRPEHLVDYLSERAGLLVPRGVEVYTFPHRTFQEYLAACYLTDDNYPKKLVELACRDPNRWREVVLLAGAKAARGAASAIWNMAEALCWRQPNDPQATSADMWGALLAGQALAETVAFEQIEPYDRAKFERIRAWLVAILTEKVPVGGPFPATERAKAGDLLAAFGDDREGVGCDKQTGLPDIEWIRIPKGTFTMGSKNFDRSQPLHPVTVPAFKISRYPVTNAQYQAFVQSGGPANDKYGGAFDLPNHPVVGVTWDVAVAFCEWLTQRLRAMGELTAQEEIRLPTEAEWEYAARGKEGRVYPWGKDDPTPELANYNETGLGTTSAVGCFPRGATPNGCEDMAGNVWEWCQDVWHDNYKGAPDDGSAWEKGGDANLRLLKGAAYWDVAGDMRCADRDWYYRDYWGDGHNHRGFRLVRRARGQ